MLAVALGALWIGKLKSHAVTGLDSPGEDSAQTVKLSESSLKTIKIVMPIAPAQKVAEDAESQNTKNASEADAAQKTVPEPCLETEVDCSDAENNLTVAKKLVLMGDYEGAGELSELVVDSATASWTQKSRASALLKRSNPR
jgi:hypothetical protein